MVKIKTHNSSQELTTKPTAKLVNPSEFTGDLKAVEGLGKFFVQKAEAFQKVQNFNDKTKARISFGRTADAIEDQFKNDPDLKTVNARSEQAYSKLIEETAGTIDDEQTRNEFLVFAESQSIDARNRIDTLTNSRLLKVQKDDYEVGMTQDTERINKLQFEGNFDAAKRLTQEKILETQEMADTFVIFPEVATERIKSLQESIAGAGQMQYEIDHMQTNSDMATVEQHLTNNLYKLDKKELTEQTAGFLKIKKALLGDQKELLETDYLNNLQTVVSGTIKDETGAERKLTNDEQISALRQMIKNGAAGLPGGVDPVLGNKVITQLKEQNATITDQRTEDQKWQAVGGKTILEMSRMGLGTEDNKIINPKDLAEETEQVAERSNDASLPRVQAHYKLIIDLLDKGILTPGEAGKEMGKDLELLTRRQDEKATRMFNIKKDAATSVTKGFFGIGKASIVSKEFLDKAQSVKDRQKLDVLNQFFEELEKAATTNEVKGVVAQFKDMMTLITVPSTINVKDGTPNGVASGTRPAEKVNDNQSTAKPANKVKPQKTETSVKFFRDNKTGQKVKVTFIGDEAVSREVVDAD